MRRVLGFVLLVKVGLASKCDIVDSSQAEGWLSSSEGWPAKLGLEIKEKDSRHVIDIPGDASSIIKVYIFGKSPAAYEDAIREMEGSTILENIKDTMKMLKCWILKDRLIFQYERFYLDVWDYYREKFDVITYTEVYEILRKIVKITRRLHRRKITHGDIKPSNFVCKDKECKSIVMIDYGHVAFNNNYKALGTFSFMPPERYQGLSRPTQTPEIDIWSIGCIVLLFFDHNSLEFFEEYSSKRHKGFIFTHEIYRKFRKHAQNVVKDAFPNVQSLISQIFKWNPEKRPTIEDLYKAIKNIGNKFFVPRSKLNKK